MTSQPEGTTKEKTDCSDAIFYYTQPYVICCYRAFEEQFQGDVILRSKGPLKIRQLGEIGFLAKSFHISLDAIQIGKLPIVNRLNYVTLFPA